MTWAGDPRKAVAQGANRLTPRTSFAARRETVRGRSQAWSADEVEAANRLRAELLEMELSSSKLPPFAVCHAAMALVSSMVTASEPGGNGAIFWTY